jgi:hypothetical protein
MRAGSQRPQLSLTCGVFGSRWLEAQPLSRSDSSTAAATPKQKAPHQLNSFMACLHLSGKQEASHEEKPNIFICCGGAASELIQKASGAMPILWVDHWVHAGLLALE